MLKREMSNSASPLFVFGDKERSHMYREYHKYVYDGPVIFFGKLLADHWKGETMAPSEQKARSNLEYRAKTELNLIAATNVRLPGTIKMVN